MCEVASARPARPALLGSVSAWTFCWVLEVSATLFVALRLAELPTVTVAVLPRVALADASPTGNTPPPELAELAVARPMSEALTTMSAPESRAPAPTEVLALEVDSAEVRAPLTVTMPPPRPAPDAVAL